MGLNWEVKSIDKFKLAAIKKETPKQTSK